MWGERNGPWTEIEISKPFSLGDGLPAIPAHIGYIALSGISLWRECCRCMLTVKLVKLGTTGLVVDETLDNLRRRVSEATDSKSALV